jgi:hypothetical protein
MCREGGLISKMGNRAPLTICQYYTQYGETSGDFHHFAYVRFGRK